jgi:SulP family sulfate permease
MNSSSTPQFPFATAIREHLRTGYSLADLRRDLLSGLTVGVVAVPLAMALAIASGVPPQHGLYTSIVAGMLIALTGGSRFSISGPTAAFVVILLPISHQYGLGGLLVTTVMAGIILLLMGVTRMGRLIQFIPYPVTTGFTAGIAVVIATLQLKDFLGLQTGMLPEHFLNKVWTLVQAFPSAHWPDIMIGSLTLAVLIIWPRLRSPIPGHLVALIAGTLLALLGGWLIDGFDVATIGDRFSWQMNGLQGQGIPPMAPGLMLPWSLPDAQGQPLGLSLDLMRDLLPAAFTVAVLGAIESLLCAVVADGLTGTKHNPDAELVGQGIGNIVAPFFGGMTATAAIARTATNIRAGGHSPVAAVVHALVVLLAVVSLATILGYLPMAALAALLVMVAWNMSEARHFAHMVRVAPRADVAVLLVCFALTVAFDMVIAVSVGVVLASVLFIQRMSALSETTLMPVEDHEHLKGLPDHVAVYDINGPLFFGAAEKAAGVLNRIHSRVEVVILDMADVPMMDMTGIVALQSLILRLNGRNIPVIIANLSPRLYRKLRKTGMRRIPGMVDCCLTLPKARQRALELRPGPPPATSAS